MLFIEQIEQQYNALFANAVFEYGFQICKAAVTDANLRSFVQQGCIQACHTLSQILYQAFRHSQGLTVEGDQAIHPSRRA
ncbi:hypothetical protein AO265_05950 [Pseudomonas sp. ABAC61]|nr:hypothetical protein AO265_05950 [Pseudomonas sp. ABAC61]